MLKGCLTMLLGAVLLVAVIVSVVWIRTAEPVRVTREHLQAINRGDYAAAYGFFSTALKQKISLESYREMAEKNSALMKSTDSTFSNRSFSGNVVSLSGTLTGLKGETIPMRFTLTQENGRWVIDGFHMGGSE